MNKPLSERMLALITIYTTKVTSMEETAENCIHYNFIISELYTKMNYIKRLETQERTNHPDYVQIFNFIDLLEIETNKIIQEELLIKKLAEDVNHIDEPVVNKIEDEIDASKPCSSEKIVFETSDKHIIEVDMSMSDIIKGGTVISDKDKQ